jgi:hypothetical protein
MALTPLYGVMRLRIKGKKPRTHAIVISHRDRRMVTVNNSPTNRIWRVTVIRPSLVPLAYVCESDE